MQQDIFGDLTRKDEVLLMLQEIAAEGRLDEYQIGLARILRFRENHRLLHVVLEYAVRIEKPSDILIAEALNVLVAQELPISIRALAAGALGHLLARRPQRIDSDFDIDKVMDTMVHVLYKLNPLHEEGLVQGPRPGARFGECEAAQNISPEC